MVVLFILTGATGTAGLWAELMPEILWGDIAKTLVVKYMSSY